MATVTRRCKDAACARRFRVSAQSRRLFCEECRPSRLKIGTVLDEPAATGEREPGPMEARAVVQLGDRATTLEGLAVVGLARALDRDDHPLSQRAAATARLLEALKVARVGAPVAADRLDEVTQRRLGKAAAAS